MRWLAAYIVALIVTVTLLMLFMTYGIGGHLIEPVMVFVGVALAFAVENLRQDLDERSVGTQHL